MKRPKERVICPHCGHANTFNRKAWKRNGRAQCGGSACGRWIKYEDLNEEGSAR